MRKMSKNIIGISLVILLMLSLVACADNNSAEAIDSNADAMDNKSLMKIGIVQIVEHPSLNSIRETFITHLAEKGFSQNENISIDYQNAQGDQGILKTICQKFVSQKYDLIVAIATPSAQAAASETKDIPILFAACTDPIGAGLITDFENPGGNITGTSDLISAKQIMELAERITPGFKKVGVLYNTGETSSMYVVEELKSYIDSNNMSLETATVINTSEVQQAVQSLIGKTDIIFAPIDNTIASSMAVVAQTTIESKVPLYVGADSMVKDGGLATYGVNYKILGERTAEMAVEILNGKSPSEIPVERMTDLNIYVNEQTAEKIGVTIPEEVLEEASVLGEWIRGI